jgi:hypothetical protein
VRRTLVNGQVFVTYQANPSDEVYGWLETAEGKIVPRSGGWYRTNDPGKAFLIADLNASAKAKEG